MPLGIMQDNNFVHVTLDIWNDKVFYQEREFPAGYFAAEILNISQEQMIELIQNGGAPTFLLPALIIGNEQEATQAFHRLREQIMHLAELIWRYPPFCYNDHEKELEQINELLDDSALPKIRTPQSEYQEQFLVLCLAMTRIPIAILHFITAAKFFEVDYLRRLGKRTETFFAIAAHDCFNSELFWKEMRELQSWDMEQFSLHPELSSTYVLARSPKNEKEMVFVNRVSFVRLVDFYTYDLFNGLHHGHAPSQCRNCGKYFLTTNGHMPKYCDGIAPQDPHLTCRQYGARMRQKEQNKNHPVYRLHATRTNTIRKHHERGKINDALRQEAIYLADTYRDRALMDNDYAANGYVQDMEQEHIYAEARKRLKR